MMTRSPFLDFVSLEHIGETANFVMQLLVGERSFLARFAFPDDGGLVPAVGRQMPVETVLGND